MNESPSPSPGGMPVPHDPADIHDQLWAGWTGRVGWDIGANVGQSLPDMCQRFAIVHAFEPAQEAWPELVTSEGAWGRSGDVHLHPIAVGEKDGLLRMSMRAAPMESGQLVALGMPYYGEDHGEGSANWGEETGTRVVACRSADSLAAQYGAPDFVKVDTEGHETLVLAGARQLLAQRRCGWLIEFHTEDRGHTCDAALAAAGYGVEVVRHPGYEPGGGMWRSHGWIRAEAP